VRTLTRRTFDPREQLLTLRDAARRPGETLQVARELAGAMIAAGRSARPASSSSLTGPVGPHRVWSWARVRLSDVKSVRARLGGTVNDVRATFEFSADGKIAEHTDDFSFWRWSRQALGAPGLLLGWTPLLRRATQRKARASLDQFLRGAAKP